MLRSSTPADPRIHFALNCTSPPLSSSVEPFSVLGLEGEEREGEVEREGKTGRGRGVDCCVPQSHLKSDVGLGRFLGPPRPGGYLHGCYLLEFLLPRSC